MNIAIYRLFISSIASLNPCPVIIKAEVLEVGKSAKIPLSKPTQSRQSKRPPQSPTLWNKYHLTSIQTFLTVLLNRPYWAFAVRHWSCCELSLVHIHILLTKNGNGIRPTYVEMFSLYRQPCYHSPPYHLRFNSIILNPFFLRYHELKSLKIILVPKAGPRGLLYSYSNI